MMADNQPDTTGDDTGFNPALAEQLQRHAVLAWDFDDTLVGHHASPAMHRYIAHTPQTRHLIITFRAQGLHTRLWNDLAAATRLIGQTHFERAIHLDDHLSDTVQRLRRLRARNLYAGPDSPAERAYRHWKGMICAQIGAGLLIDDRTDDVQPGCAAFGVELLHPDAFL